MSDYFKAAYGFELSEKTAGTERMLRDIDAIHNEAMRLAVLYDQIMADAKESLWLIPWLALAWWVNP